MTTIEQHTHTRNLRATIYVTADNSHVARSDRGALVWGAYYRRPEWSPDRWIITGWYQTEEHAARYARPIDGGVLRVLPTADEIAEEAVRVAGVDADVTVDRVGSSHRAKLVLAGQCGALVARADVLYDTLRGLDAGADARGVLIAAGAEVVS